MVKRLTALEHILQHKIVAIIRGKSFSDISSVVNALYSGGITTVEITLNSEKALDGIAQVSHQFQNKMLVGAGTVLTTADAKNAIAAGASFIISPSLNAAVIKATKKSGAVSIPGAFTATEMVAANNFGADIIKIFPCLNAAYVKDILAPLNHLKVMPTGGINAGNIQTYAATGAVAFGVGSALVNNAIVNDDYLQQLTNKAAELINLLKKATA